MQFPHRQTTIQKIETVQRKAMQLIDSKIKWERFPTYLLAISGLVTPEARAGKAGLKLMYQLRHNHTPFKLHLLSTNTSYQARTYGQFCRVQV